MNSTVNDETLSMSPSQGTFYSSNITSNNITPVVNTNSPTLNPNNSSSSLTSTNTNNNVAFSGYLMKWTNYIKGYQKRWFVLNNGLLSYFR